MGCVPVLSAAYGSLRSCECLLESKFVKKDESGMDEHSGWETLPPLPPLTIRAETLERFSCRDIQTHTRALTRRKHTRTCALAQKNKTHEIHLGSRSLLQFFIFIVSVVSWTGSIFPHLPHTFSITNHTVTDHNNGDMENKIKLNPSNKEVLLVFVHC